MCWQSSWKSERRRYSFAMFTNSSWSVRKRRTSAARRPICVAAERSSSLTPPWRKRWSASASSASGVSIRSSAFLRNVDLSSLIQLWMQLRISGSPQVAPRDAERGLGRLGVGGPRRRGAAGRLSSPISSSPVGARGHGRAQQALGLLDAVPAEVVDHLPAEPAEERAVGLAEEVEDDPPLRAPVPRPRVGARTRCSLRRDTKCPMRSAIASRSFLSSARNGPSSARGIASV